MSYIRVYLVHLKQFIKFHVYNYEYFTVLFFLIIVKCTVRIYIYIYIQCHKSNRGDFHPIKRHRDKKKKKNVDGIVVVYRPRWRIKIRNINLKYMCIRFQMDNITNCILTTASPFGTVCSSAPVSPIV